MKHNLLSSRLLLLAIVACQQLESTARANITNNITPSAVSNTFSGFITLQVTGLTNGETVVVQKFLDLNTNGVIDAGDWLVQQFNLTNLQPGMMIGGIVNSNVPGDTGSTPGQITAQLNFQNGDFMQNLTAQYLYKVSSPSGRWTPLTNLFAVTNFPFPQKLTGNVVSNSTSTAVPNAVILLFGPPRAGHNGPSTPQGGTVANNAGSYTMPAPAGTYVPMAFSSNYVANYTTSPVLTLTNSATLTTNLAMTTATSSITGKVVDANNASLGLPGVFMPASANGLITVTFTDTNGNFTMPVTAGQWGVGSDDRGLIVHGYVGWNNSTNINAGGAVTLAYSQANALFYGSVKDYLGNPIAGVGVEADDNNNLYDSEGSSDANGKYFVGALGLSSDPWRVSVSSDRSPTNYVFSQPAFEQNGGTNLSVGAAVKVSFTALPATNHITGNVSANGTNIVGVEVYANATVNGANYQTQTDTDANGNYWLNVTNGTWSVSVNCNGGSESLDGIIGPGTYQCPENQTTNIVNDNAVVNFPIELSSIGPYYQLYGYVTNNLDNPIVGVNVYANNGTGDNLTTNTDDSGYYSFTVGNGNWDVSVNCDDLTSLGYQCVSDQNVNVSGSSVEQDFTVQPIVPDVLNYYVMKLEAYLQVGPTNLVPDTNFGPFNAFLNVVQSATGTVWFALVVLPTGAEVALPLGGSGLELENMESFPTQAAIDTAYPPGNYTFWLDAVDDGTLSPVLTMPSAAYPSPPQVSNFAAAQAINPLSPFTLQWNAIPGAATNGVLWVFATDANGDRVFSTPDPATNPGAALPGTATSTVIPTNTFQPGQAYTGWITFFQTTSVNTNDYPGAVGVTLVAATTSVPLALASARPTLGQPARLSGNQFQFQFSGLAGQNYTVQVSTNLASTNWHTLLITNLLASPVFIQDNQATNKERFYRVMVGP